MGDVGERPGVHERRLALERLHHRGMQGLAQQHGHRSGNPQILECDRLAPLGRSNDDAAAALTQVAQGRGVVVAVDEREDRHQLAGDGDVVTRLTRTPIRRAPEADDRVAQRPVVHVHDPAPGDAVWVDGEAAQAELPQSLVGQSSLVVPPGIDRRGHEVVRHRDGVDVAGEVQVELVHRDDLAVAAAGGAALDAERGPHARLPDAGDGLVPQRSQPLHQADGRRRLPLPKRGRCDGGHVHVLAPLTAADTA